MSTEKQAGTIVLGVIDRWSGFASIGESGVDRAMHACFAMFVARLDFAVQNRETSLLSRLPVRPSTQSKR